MEKTSYPKEEAKEESKEDPKEEAKEEAKEEPRGALSHEKCVKLLRELLDSHERLGFYPGVLYF